LSGTRAILAGRGISSCLWPTCAAVDLQPLGRLRRPSASLRLQRSGSSAKQELGTPGSVDLPVAVVRNGTADAGKTPVWPRSIESWSRGMPSACSIGSRRVPEPDLARRARMLSTAYASRNLLPHCERGILLPLTRIRRPSGKDKEGLRLRDAKPPQQLL
jgi:hypothetical protein